MDRRRDRQASQDREVCSRLKGRRGKSIKTDPSCSQRCVRETAMSSTAAPVPNVVFIISDHHRWDYMGCVGADFVRTPNLDGLAACGTVVSQTYCTAPVCVPSRVAITSGRYPMNTGCFSLWLPADPAMPTFLHSLRDQGIHTAMIGKFHHHVLGAKRGAALRARIRPPGQHSARQDLFVRSVGGSV